MEQFPQRCPVSPTSPQEWAAGPTFPAIQHQTLQHFPTENVTLASTFLLSMQYRSITWLKVSRTGLGVRGFLCAACIGLCSLCFGLCINAFSTALDSSASFPCSWSWRRQKCLVYEPISFPEIAAHSLTLIAVLHHQMFCQLTIWCIQDALLLPAAGSSPRQESKQAWSE